MPKQPLYELPFAPPQGISHEVNASTPLQRGTSPFEVWYSGVPNQTAYATISTGAGSIRAYPVIIGRAGIIDRLAFEVTTVGGAGSVGRCAIYNSTSPTNIYPSSLVVDGGEFACDAGTTKVTTLSPNIYLAPGLYWFCALTGVAAPTLRALAAASSNAPLGIPSTMGSAPNRSFSVTFAYAAFPSTFPAGAAAGTTTPIAVHIRFAS